ncbi:MAG: acyltransferase family protein [Burkholderiaceae bacterium]
MTSARQLSEIESVRGIAALLVCIYHIPMWQPDLFNIPFIRSSHVMVELFFVLSGFVICRAYGERLTSWQALGRFQWLRFGRLYPVHLLFLGFWLAVEFAKFWLTANTSIDSPNTQPFGQNSVGALIEQLFLVQSLGFSNHATTFNFPAWSISTEFYTYLIFGLLALLIPRQRVGASALLILGCLGLLVFWADGIGTFDKMLRCLAGFFIGCLAYEGLKQAEQAGHKPWPAILLALSLVSILVFLWIKPADRRFDLLIFPLTAGLLACVVLCREGFVNRWLRHKLLLKLGLISYSVYMGHVSVIWTVTQFFRVVLRRSEVVMANGQSVPVLSAAEAAAAYGFVIVATLLLASLVYRLIENPARMWSRQVAWSGIATRTS